MHAYTAQATHRIAQRRVIVPKMARMRALAYYLVLRVVGRGMFQLNVVWLNFTNHGYIIFHANIIVSIYLVIALLNILCFHVHQVYIRLLFTTILF